MNTTFLIIIIAIAVIAVLVAIAVVLRKRRSGGVVGTSASGTEGENS